MSSSITTSVSTNESAVPDYTPEAINEHARRTFATVGVVMVLSGVLGNLLFLTVLFQQFRRKHSVHILFLANLSLADLLTVGYWFSFFVLDFILYRHPVVDHTHCVFNGVVIITLYQVCVYFLVSISLNRYLHVCHTHLYKRVFTLPRTVAWCVCVWVVSLLVAIVPVVDNSSLYGYSPITRFCSYSRDGVSYVKVLLLTLAILPMALGAYCNIAIYCHWRKLRLSSLKRYPLAKRDDKDKKGRVLDRWMASVKRRTAGAAMEVEEGHGKNCVKATAFETPLRDVTASEDKRDSGGDDSASSNTASSLSGHDCTGGEGKHGVLSVHAEVHNHQFTDRMAEEKKSSSTSLSSSSSSSESDEDSESAESLNNENAINAGPIKTPVSVSQDTPGQHPQHHRLDDDIRAAVTSSAVSTSPTPTPASRGPEAIESPLTHKKHHHHHHHHQQHKAKQNGQAGKAAQQGAHSRGKSHKAREVAFIRSLFVVFILAGVTLVPYAVMTILKDYIDLSTELVIFGNFFLLFNNSLNWIVYGVMNLSFRRGYVQNTRKIFTVCCPSKFRNAREEKSFDFSSTPSALRVLTRNDVSSSTSQISPGNS